MIMPTVDQAVDEFLGLKRIAVVGVSRQPGGAHASNGIYSRLKERGYEVFPVNPHADEVMGDACYRSLKDIPDGVEGVVIATNPKDTISVARECNELGIDKIWIHKNIGAGSYSREAHDYCRDNDITTLVSCPLWYGKTSDGFHKFFGATCRLLRQVPSEI
jgi:predicted CoA-binding protein